MVINQLPHMAPTMAPAGSSRPAMATTGVDRGSSCPGPAWGYSQTPRRARAGYISSGHPTNEAQEARVYSHDGPIRRRKRGYILAMDRSDAGSAGIFSRWTNQTQVARVRSPSGPKKKILPCHRVASVGSEVLPHAQRVAEQAVPCLGDT
eukprot:2541705-Pyramimonas_sp.AAC.1